jgi:hypothetical protein
MDAELIEKWFSYWRPLEMGFTPNGHANALTLTLGVFWARSVGGYNLYRWTGDRAPVQPGRIVGAAASEARQISNFPFIKHEASTVYWYLLRAVGAGGVEEATTNQIRRAEFDADGVLIGPHPNPPTHLTIDRLCGGRFCLRWGYDPTDQETSPAGFDIYNDAAAPGQNDYGSPVGSVDFKLGRAVYEWTSEPFADGMRVGWAVRARSAEGVVENNLVNLAGLADAAGPPVHPDIEAIRTDDMP